MEKDQEKRSELFDQLKKKDFSLKAGKTPVNRSDVMSQIRERKTLTVTSGPLSRSALMSSIRKPTSDLKHTGGPKNFSALMSQIRKPTTGLKATGGPLNRSALFSDIRNKKKMSFLKKVPPRSRMALLADIRGNRAGINEAMPTRVTRKKFVPRSRTNLMSDIRGTRQLNKVKFVPKSRTDLMADIRTAAFSLNKVETVEKGISVSKDEYLKEKEEKKSDD